MNQLPVFPRSLDAVLPEECRLHVVRQEDIHPFPTQGAQIVLKLGTQFLSRKDPPRSMTVTSSPVRP